MKKFWIVFVILAFVVLGSLGLLWRFLGRIDEGLPAGGGVLHWRADQTYEEERDDSLLGQLLHGRPPTMREIVFAVERAARDDRVQGLLVDIGALPVDWAKVEELRDCLSRFQASGKPLVAYLEWGGTKEYALAVAADQVVLAPEAGLMVLGISAEMSFVKGTLDKLGMQADFVHVGKYKSAPEMLTRSEPTPAHREMMQAIVDSRYDALIEMIARGRRVTPEEAKAWVEIGIFDADSAMQMGLVDTVLCKEDIAAWRFDSQKLVPLENYALGRGRERTVARVALLHATGTIVPGESHYDRWQGRTVGSETLVEQLRTAGEDDGIAAVLLRVDSPGGSATASDLIWHEVARVRDRKPVVVSMSGYAASGGYYISCGADSIFAEPGTLTGSIGVFAGKIDMEGFYRMLGIQREYVTRGENALLFGNNAVFSDAQRQRLTELLNAFYGRFVAKVAEGRKLPVDSVEAIAQGRVWTGDQALAEGLVDDLGGLQRALTAVKWMIGVSPDQRVALVSYERQLSLLERLLVQSLHESRLALPPAVSEAIGLLAGGGALGCVPLLNGQLLAMSPFWIQLR